MEMMRAGELPGGGGRPSNSQGALPIGNEVFIIRGAGNQITPLKYNANGSGKAKGSAGNGKSGCIWENMGKLHRGGVSDAAF